jgi:hypothetical protein
VINKANKGSNPFDQGGKRMVLIKECNKVFPVLITEERRPLLSNGFPFGFSPGLHVIVKTWSDTGKDQTGGVAPVRLRVGCVSTVL